MRSARIPEADFPCVTDSPLDRVRAEAARTPLVRVAELAAVDDASPLDQVVLVAAVTPLDRVQLASVRPYRRTSPSGRPENVRGYVDTRFMHPGGYIPQPDWEKGQRSWVAKGEAAWKARGEAARAEAAHKEAVAAEKDPENKVAPGISYRLGKSDSARDAAAAQARTPAGVPSGLPDSPVVLPRKPSAPAAPQNFGAGMFYRATEVHTTEVHAVFGAAAESGIYSHTEIAELRVQITHLQSQLEATSNKAEWAHRRISIESAKALSKEEKDTGSRATMALGLGSLVGGAIFAAITAGLGLPSVLAAAVALLPTATQVLLQHFVADKESGLQRLLGHPIKKLREGNTALRESRGKEAARKALGQTKSDILASSPLDRVLMLANPAPAPGSAAPGPPSSVQPPAHWPQPAAPLSPLASGTPQEQTAMVLRAALVSHGLPPEAAVPLADEMARRGVEHALSHMAAHKAAAAKSTG